MRLKDNPSACVEPEYRKERTCRECYFSQVNEKNQWTGTQRCWNAGCIEADTGDTPTDKLRAMLDELGVEYGSGFGGDTLWTGRDGIEWRWDKQENILAMYSHTITPEQAIAATVGVGTCKLVDNDSGPDMHCTACGGEVDDEYRYFMDSWGYSRCPHCGARIIEEETE